MTRHSNTLVFGTNTSFGVKVGADATSTPGITVGYSRQEAVVIPVVANTADNGTVLAPCPQIVTPGTVKADLPDNCRLIANDGTDTDTLSVLASFGTKYNAGGGNSPNVGGEISQYFATGLAARTLAARAGAAAVASGEAAIASAESLEMVTSRAAGIDELAKKVAALASVDAVAAAMTAVDRQLGGNIFTRACATAPATTPSGCSAALRADSRVTTRSPAKLAQAIAAF